MGDIFVFCTATVDDFDGTLVVRYRIHGQTKDGEVTFDEEDCSDWSDDEILDFVIESTGVGDAARSEVEIQR